MTGARFENKPGIVVTRWCVKGVSMFLCGGRYWLNIFTI